MNCCTHAAPSISYAATSRLGKVSRASSALLTRLGPSHTEPIFPSSGPSLVKALLGSSVAKPSLDKALLTQLVRLGKM